MSENSTEKQDSPKQGSMSLVDHLSELRVRIIRFLMVMGVLVLCCYFYRKEILDLIKKPVEIPLQKYTTVSSTGISGTSDLGKLSNFYQCSCENTVDSSSNQDLDSEPQVSVDQNSLTANIEPAKSIENKAESGVTEWTERTKDVFFDFVAYFQVLLGKEPTASRHYVSPPPKSNRPIKYEKTLNLNCQCQLNLEDQKETHSTMVYIGLPELFFAQMKAAIFAGFFLAFPYLLIELWGFVGPALYRTEKKIFWIFAYASYICFIGGSLFGYFIVFPYGFDFFLSLTQPGEIMPSLSVGEYLNFSIKLLLAFGFIFEMPLVTFILARMGIITPELMIKQSRVAIMIIFILSAFLTPPDPFTMVLMAGPLVMLYIISIIVCLLGVNRKKVALKEQGIDADEF